MDDGVPTIDTDDYHHNQQPIGSTEDGEPAVKRSQVEYQNEQESTTLVPAESTSDVTTRSPTQTDDTDDVIHVEEITTTSHTPPIVSLPDSLQSKLTLSGTCHKRMPKEHCNFMYKLDL